MNDHITDIVSAVREEGVTTALESESFQIIIAEAASQIIAGPAAPLVGSIIGATAPRINGVILTYKQNRFERNMIRLMKDLTARVDNLESNYVSLSEELQERYRGLYVEMLLDNVIDERQEEKIKWNVNGFVNLMTNESNENIMQIFFDTLAELTVLDIDTLNIYYSDSDIDWREVEYKYGIDSERLKLVKEKLVRLGLLCRKNDILRDKNIDEVVEYLKKMESASKKRNSQGVKIPHSIKKIGNIVTYRITPLGVGFLRSISEASRDSTVKGG